MHDVEVDAARRCGRAQGGATWGDFNRTTQAVGLAAIGGEVSSTGIAGLTLGGGLGWLMGKCGLACDNLVEAEVLCANGRLVIANEREHTDLFWGLRGGGGNFGVVTRFEYRLHPLRGVLAGMVLYPMRRAAEVLECYRASTADCADELTAMALLLTTADLEPAVGVIVCHCGDAANAERAVRPLRSLGGALVDTVGRIPYLGLQAMLDETAPAGRCNYWKASFVPTLDDTLIAALIAESATIPSPFSSILVEHLHGAPRLLDARLRQGVGAEQLLHGNGQGPRLRRMSRQQGKSLDVELEVIRGPLHPQMRVSLARQGVVRRVDLDRSEVLGVVAQPRLGS